MTQQIEHTWVTKILNSDELKQFINFEKKLKTQFTLADKETFEQNWSQLVNDVNENLKNDPCSDIGIVLGERCMNWVNSVYGKEYAGLRSTIWVKGFKGGVIGEEHGISHEAILWLDKAMDAYSKKRITTILKKVDNYPHQVLLKEWENMLADFFGDEKILKDEFLQDLINDENISQAAKNWLKNLILNKQI